jgi:long-chain acyl-CoA synthetase
MPGLKVIISMDSLASDNPGPGRAVAGSVLRTYAQDKGVVLYDWSEVETLGVQHGRKHTPAAPSDTYTICYTSGTTGMPVSLLISTAGLLLMDTESNCELISLFVPWF